jgi:hypothetical protein
MEFKMKKEIKILFIGLMAGFLLYSCKEPGPVELIDDDVSLEEQLDIEVLAPEPGVYVYSNGYDTTGIVEPLTEYTSLISVSGIQYTYKNISINSMFNVAMVFDKSRPVYGENDRIVGYHLNPLGNVFFNGEQAGEKEWRLRYRTHEGEKDTALGKYHVLSRLFSPNGQYAFPYDSYINFELISGSGQGMGRNINFNIPTPEKVVGRVELVGSRRNHDVRIDLHWNVNSRKDALIEIILGGFLPDRDEVFPIVKFRTYDDGYLRVPHSIIKSFPFDRFDAMVLTFRRSMRKTIQNDILPDNYIIAQSIHSIKIDVP